MTAVELLIVEAIRPAGSAGFEVTFHTKQRATLLSGHDEYGHWERLLRQSRDGQRPVGVSVSNGEIHQVTRADRDIVRELVENGPNRVDVWFTGHDGKFHFERSNPHATRIRDTLVKSKKSGSWAWFAFSLPDLTILNAASEEELPRRK